jgi:hypothetical protein
MAIKNGFIVLDENDWRDATPEQRDWMIYKTLKSMDGRLQALEGKSMFNRVCMSIGAVVGGMVGGIGAVLGLGK